MNSHKNARTTFAGRKLLIERIGVRTARKWRARFEQEGLAGLPDRSSRPLKARSTVDAELAARIKQLRRARMGLPNGDARGARNVAQRHGNPSLGELNEYGRTDFDRLDAAPGFVC